MSSICARLWAIADNSKQAYEEATYLLSLLDDDVMLTSAQVRALEQHYTTLKDAKDAREKIIGDIFSTYLSDRKSAEIFALEPLFIPFLLKITKDNPTPPQYESAIVLLGKMGKPAIPSLIQLLDSPTPDIRNRVMTVLGANGSTAEPAIPKLISLFDAESESQSRSAAFALGNIGSAAIPSLLFTLREGQDHEKKFAAIALGEMGTGALLAVPELIQALTDSRNVRSIRCAVAEALGKIGPGAKDAAPHLVKALEDLNPLLRKDSATALGRIKANPEKTIPALIKLVSDSDDKVATAAVVALGEFGPLAGKAVGIFGTVLGKRTREQFKIDIANTLGKIGTEALPTLISALEKERSTSVTSSIQNSLVKIGDESVPSLVNLLREPRNEEFRQEIAFILSKTGCKGEISYMLNLLKEDPEPMLRQYAARAIRQTAINTKEKNSGIIGTKMSVTVSHLIDTLNTEKDPNVRNEILNTLATFGPNASGAVPKLIEMVVNSQNQLAVTTLGEIGPPAAAALPHLLDILEHHSDKSFRAAAAKPLAQIAPDDEKVLDALIEALKDSDKSVCWSAALAIGIIGPGAKKAVPDLLAALKKRSNGNVRDFTVSALGDIGIGATSALSDLIPLIEIEDKGFVIVTLLPTIRSINPQAREAAPGMLKLLRDKTQPNSWRKDAADFLAALEPPVPEAIQLLAYIAENDASPQMRMGAEETLKNIRSKMKKDEFVEKEIY